MAAARTVPSVRNAHSRVPTGPVLLVRRTGRLLMAQNLPAVPGRRSLAQVPPRSLVRAVREIESNAVVEAARVEAVTYVTYAGLQAVANLAEVEGRLLGRSPLAERRLQLIGDIGAAKIAQILDGMRP